MVVFVDMDEVLADFIGGVCGLLGITRQQLERHRQPGEWSIYAAVQRYMRRSNPKAVFGPYQMWDMIGQEGEAYWTGLEELSWFEELIRLLDELTTIHFVDWYVLSSPYDSPECREGKIKWMKSRFGEDFNRYILTPHKHLLASQECVLIDDRPENCSAFEEAGGRAIMFPSPGNMLAPMASNPLSHVRQQLNLIKESL